MKRLLSLVLVFGMFLGAIGNFSVLASGTSAVVYDFDLFGYNYSDYDETVATVESRGYPIRVGAFENISNIKPNYSGFKYSSITKTANDKTERRFFLHDAAYSGTDEFLTSLGMGTVESGRIRTATQTNVTPNVVENWGFNGFQFANNKLTSWTEANGGGGTTVWNNTLDVSPYLETGYAVWNIEIPESYLTVLKQQNAADPLHDIYLALAFGTLTQDYEIYGNGYFGKENFTGVPLKDYYDADKGGYQTIAVPLSSFNNKTGNFNCYAIPDDKANDARAALYFTTNAKYFHGMGLIRNDTDADNVTGFAYDAKAMAILNVNKPTKPELQFNDTTKQVTISWSAVENNGFDLQLVKKNNGTETVLVSDATAVSTYTDDLSAGGECDYVLRITDEKYGVKFDSEASSVNIEIQTTIYDFGLFDYCLNTYNDWGGVINSVESGTIAIRIGNRAEQELMPDFRTKRAASLTKTASDLTERRFYIHDQGYDAIDEYVIANGLGENADYMNKGNIIETTLSDGITVEKWGFNGFQFTNRVINHDPLNDGLAEATNWYNTMDLSGCLDTGYAVYNIQIPSAYIEELKEANPNDPLDGIYLAVGFGRAQHWDITGNGGFARENFTGVPLKDYYDIEKGGYQTIAVPLSSFDNSAGNFNCYATSDNRKLDARATLYFADKGTENSAKYFHGMGVIREDRNDSKVTGFAYDVKAMSIVSIGINKPDTPVVQYDSDDMSATISWEAISNVGMSMQLIRISNGEEAVLVADAASTTSYVDDLSAGGEYSYCLRVTSSKYGELYETEKATVSTLINPIVYDFGVLDYYYNIFYGGGAKDTVESYAVPINVGVRDVGQLMPDYATIKHSSVTKTKSDNTERRFYIHDNGYTKADEYLAANVDNAAEFVDEGTISNVVVAEQTQKWGFNGFQFANKIINHNPLNDGLAMATNWYNTMDLSGCLDTGYAVYNMQIPSAYIEELEEANPNDPLDGIYLAVGFGRAQHWDITGNGGFGRENFTGVPLKDYYDIERGGYQTIAVPLSSFDNSEDSFNCYATDNNKVLYERNFLHFADKGTENSAKYFHGMGIIREDRNDSKVTGFAYDVKAMGIYRAATIKNVYVNLDDKDVNVSWTASNTAGVCNYKIYRDGTEIATTNSLSYKDVNVPAGVHNYMVAPVINVYGGFAAKTTGASVKVPDDAVFYSGDTPIDYMEEGTIKVIINKIDNAELCFVARYNSDKLKEIKKVEFVGATAELTFNCSAADTINVLWWGNAIQPIKKNVLLVPKTMEDGEIVITYPNYSTKAVTFSLDDGNVKYDQPICDLLHEYDLKATFNLCSFANVTDRGLYLHDDFEIANHTSHIEMYDSTYSYEDCVKAIEDGYNGILNNVGVQARGVVWPYHAPRERVFYNDLHTYMLGEGYEYVRNTESTRNFNLPTNWMEWSATAWTQEWLTYTELFVNAEPTNDLQLLYLAGHTSDKESDEMLEYCTEIFELVSRNDIWSATNLEICRYAKATSQLEFGEQFIYNGSDTNVYMLVDGKRYCAAPHDYAKPVI